MLLPSPAVRAALRLDSPAKRFAWASEQLYAALIPSPAVAADTLLGIPAKPLTRGIAATNLLSERTGDMYALTEAAQPLTFNAKFYLPFDLVQYNRGVPLLLCVGTLTTDTYQPHVGAIVTGAPIPDNSVMQTFEQYIVEQLSLMIVGSNGTTDFNKTALRYFGDSWFTSEYSSKMQTLLFIVASLNRTGFVNNNRYNDITGIATV